MVALNARAAQLLARPRAELLGRNVWDAFPEAVGSVFDDVFSRAGASGAEIAFSAHHPPLGAWFEVRAHPSEEGVVVLFRDVTAERARVRELAAVACVAEAVARGLDPAGIFALVADAVAAVFDAWAGIVWRFEGRRAVAAGVAGGHGLVPGTAFPLAGGGALPRVAVTGAPARASLAALGPSDPVARRVVPLGYSTSVAAPVRVAGRVWGALLVSGGPGWAPEAEAESRLARFAELIAMAVAAGDAREELSRLAATDDLTGLANRRTFRDRLRDEVERARRHGLVLSLAMLDLDHFKRVNDDHGHAVGDAVLRDVATLLRGRSRTEDVVARIGGEEFAWLMPETGLEGAREAAERLRAALATRLDGPAGPVTISVGVAEAVPGYGPDDVIRRADEALYAAKNAGRNRVAVADAVPAPDASAIVDDGVRAPDRRDLAGVRALARAIDAKDPSTSRHSERVADLSVRIAWELGWNADDIAKLREAALIHDVGKIGVPDAILLKPGRLTEHEYDRVKEHAPLGGQIAGEVLSAEQAGWVRHHHERWDGRGYPDGLAGEEIPEGARIIALADAVDVMTNARVYSQPRNAGEAVAECRRVAGTQFWAPAVDALARLHEVGGVLPDRPLTLR